MEGKRRHSTPLIQQPLTRQDRLPILRCPGLPGLSCSPVQLCRLSARYSLIPHVADVAAGKGTASARMGDEQHACGICIDRPRAVRSLPCGHGGLCELCTIELILQAVPRGPNCAYCRCTVSRLIVVPVTTATAVAGQVLPRRMPTNQAVPEPEGHVFKSIEAFLRAMLDSADAEVANAARTALARMPGQGAVAAASEDGHGVRRRPQRQETVTAPLAAASLDVNAADHEGWTALILAAGRGHTRRRSRRCWLRLTSN